MPRRSALIALLLVGLGGCGTDGDALLGRLQRFKDAMCACRDRECGERVAAELVDWSLQHARELSRVRASNGARAVVNELGRCQDERLRLQ